MLHSNFDFFLNNTHLQAVSNLSESRHFKKKNNNGTVIYTVFSVISVLNVMKQVVCLIAVLLGSNLLSECGLRLLQF